MNAKRIVMNCAAMVLLTLAAATAGAEDAQATTLAVTDAPGYVGSWKLSMDFQGRPVEMTLNVVDVDGKIGATIESERQPEPVAVTEAKMTDDGLSLTYPMSFGGNDMTLNLVAKLEGEALKGTLSESSGLFTADLTGTKAEAAPAGEAKAETTVPAKPTELDTIAAQDFVGEWTLAFEVMGNEVEMGLDIMDAEGKIAAIIDSEIQPNAAPIEKAEMTDDGLKLSYPMDFGGQALSMTIVAKLQENALVGKIAEASGLFSAEFTGERRSVESGEGASANAEEGEGRRRGRRGASPTTTMKVGDKNINIAFADLKMGAPEGDYEKLAGITDGTVFKFVGGRATKLRTDLSLKFGETIVKQGNAAPNYPGVYSMWLKKVGDGWHLVFNEHADIWGTQHEDQADVAEVPLEFSQSETPQETFKIELLPEGEEAGTLKISWGPMVWTAKFAVVKDDTVA